MEPFKAWARVTMESRMSFWGRSLLAALAYGLAYAMLREATLSHISVINWIPMAGLRLICLLLAPARYWPALMVGEAIPLGYQNYQCLDLVGLPWVLVASVPRMLYTAPIVHWLRKRWPNLEKNLAHQIGPLLLCMFLVSLALALHGMLNYSLAKQLAPGELPIPLWLYGSRLLTSGYLSLLTVTPAALWIATYIGDLFVQRRLPPRLFIHLIRDSRCWGTAALLAAIVGLVVIGQKWGIAVHALTLAGMLAVLMVAAWRYGWQSTALVGAAANLGVVALMPTQDDPLTIQVQCVIALVMSALLLLGARTSASRGLARDLCLAEQKAAAAREQARQELFSNERHRLSYATMLDQVFDHTRQEAIRVLHDVRAALPSRDIAKHYRQFDELQQTHKSLTDGLSPPAWLKLGGSDGPIATSLHWLGARCEIELPSPISGLARLSTELSIAIYRMSCEAVGYLMKEAPSDEVRIAMAVHEEEGKRPVVEIVLESLGEVLNASAELYTSFLLSLGASGMNVKALERRAQLYDGHMKVERISERHMRMLFRVVDPAPP